MNTVLDGDLDARYREDFAERNSDPGDPEALGVDWRANLRAASEQYASRLAKAGVLARLRDYPGASHGFFHLLAATADARDAVGWSAEAVRHAFSRYAAGKPGNSQQPAGIGTAGTLLL